MTAHPLEVSGVRIRHDEREQFTPDGVDFVVRAGEVVLVLGPSGSGKSTLALALNGLVPHAIPATMEGTVLVAGLDSREHPVAELSGHIGMVFQDPDAQIVTGNLLDEVCFGPENLLLGRAEVLERAESALRSVGLWERRTENPDRLSGGGRQRLAIACALALRPAVIVLDEPTANLDPVGIDDVYATLGALVASSNVAIVLVEHNLDAAMDLIDRAMVIDAAGRLAFDGPVASVIRDNAAELTAMGVWLPVATLAAIRLRDAGVHIDPLPLTPRALAEALDAIAELPAVPGLPAVPELVEGPGVAPFDKLRDRDKLRDHSEPAVSVTGLRVQKKSTVILRDVDLTVGRGDFLAIVGTNGAGKTTLLQAIAGVVAPPKGTVSVGGIDPATADVRALAREIGFVFQNPEHQFIRATVREELSHGLEIQGLDEQDIADRVDRMLHRFGLTEHADAHPFLLSGGQKRRLSVGTALIAGAPVLALDEPTFGQDRERAAELLDILSALRDEGTTVLVVTHDMQLVADYATHIAVLRDGAVVEHGEAGHVLAGTGLDAAGLRPPPLARAMRAMTRHPGWHRITRMRDLP